MRFLKLIMISFVSVLLLNCVHDDDYSAPIPDFPVLKTNITIGEVKTLASANPIKLNGDSILEGYVVSSDEGGNVYKSLHIVTPEGKSGIQININKSSLYNFYPVYRKVYIKLKNLYLANQNDMVQLGGESQGSYAVSQLVWNVAAQNILLAEEKKEEAVLVQKFENLAEAMNDANLNTLIEINNVQFTSNFVGKPYYDAANAKGGGTDNKLEDAQGGVLNVRVGQYSKFAKEVIPDNSGKVRGILTKYGKDYQLLVRSIADINLTEKRFTSGFSDGTESNPYLANEVSKHQQETAKWVSGYIVGVVNGASITTDSEFSPPFSAASNILLAASPTETDPSKCVPVQLIYDATGVNTARQALNLKDNPTNLGREVLIKGDLDTYYKVPAIKNTNDYRLK